MTRSHARSLKGERAESVEPFKPGKKISVIGALSLTGVGATMSVEGSVDTEVFDAYVQHFLAPTLFKGDIVLLDNVKFHYSQRAIKLIEQVGASVLHIPAYSPDFNPIEECISKIKALLRAAKARTDRDLRAALAKAIKNVAIDDACGWFANSGYTYSLI